MSVTAPAGFLAGGVASGIKGGGALDLALVATVQRRPVAAAGVFTTNRAPAAPVQVCRQHLASSRGRAAAVILNSGNANAATGAGGMEVAERMCSATAQELGVGEDEVLVCSTGLIGVGLPWEPLAVAIPGLVGGLGRSPRDGTRAATAIMTTDTRAKEVVVGGDGFVVGGMAKGAAMLAPRMATMLAVLTTDAGIGPAALGTLLRRAARETFNVVTVDGCTSTNDTVVALASGSAGRVEGAELGRALTWACQDLAGQMLADAEGATKVVRVAVSGAATTAEARRAARRVADSQLVKCSMHGADPYWGRVVSELATAGVAFRAERVRVSYGGIEVCRDGVAAPHDRDRLERHLSGARVDLEADLGMGAGRAEVLTTDLSPAYIAENMRTS